MIVNAVQRWRDRRSSFRPAGETFDPRSFEVAPIPDDVTAKAFVATHHYEPAFPAARFRFGIFRGDELVGVAVFADPFPTAPKRLELPSGTIELSRFVLLDHVGGNAESWFLARAFELLRGESPVVLSFSDPLPRQSVDGALVHKGHVGTIYQAHNAVYRGPAPSRTIRLLPSGHVFSARAISKIRAGERGWRYAARTLEAFGAEVLERREDGRAWLATWLPRLTRAVRHPGNHGYVWALDKRARKHLGKAEPYPKIEIARAA